MPPEVEQIIELTRAYLPNLVKALAILVFGWLAALVITAMVRGGLRRSGLDRRLARWVLGDEKSRSVAIEQWISKGLFYLLMLFVLVGFFQVLGLTLVTEPLNRLLTQIFEFLPQLLGAGLLLLIAWVLASALRLLITRVLGAVKLDERIGSPAGLKGERAFSITKSLAETVYWLVLLLVLPAVLNALALQGLLAPVQAMLDKILAILPNVFSAALILVVGWFLARIVQRVVTNLLVAVGADRLSDRVGLAPVLGVQGLSGVLGFVVYVLILIPVLVASLNALALQAITQPASNMLNTILTALPAIFAAVLVLSLAYLVGRVVAGLISRLLTGVGFNAVLARVGLGKEPAAGERTVSEAVGFLVLVTIMLFATIEAARQLGFTLLADLVAQFTVFAGHVTLGLIIFGIGLYLADLASRTVRASGAVQAGLIAMTARLSIIVLSGAMALRQMGLANEIINLAFGLLLGAIAVAMAIALGLGGRDIASRELSRWVDSIKTKKSKA